MNLAEIIQQKLFFIISIEDLEHYKQNIKRSFLERLTYELPNLLTKAEHINLSV